MPVEQREQAIAIWLGSTGNGRNPMFNGRRQPSCDGTSRISREAYVPFCERLGGEIPRAYSAIVLSPGERVNPYRRDAPKPDKFNPVVHFHEPPRSAASGSGICAH